MNWLFDRLQEPSTHAGLAVVGLSGNMIAAGNWQAAMFSLLTGLMAIIKQEVKR